MDIQLCGNPHRGHVSANIHNYFVTPLYYRSFTDTVHDSIMLVMAELWEGVLICVAFITSRY